MPPGEELEALAATKTTLAIHLSINNLASVVRTLVPHYGETCPVVIAYRVTWPDQLILRGDLSTIRNQVKLAGITRTALILVGPVLAASHYPDSALYNSAHTHVLRK